jgi:Flp pilus assembly protein TadD
MQTMLSMRYVMPLFSAALLLVVLAACESTQPASTMPAASQPDGASSPAPDPRSDRDRARERQWQEAIAGVSFDTGRVIVERPLDANEYQASMDEGRAKLEINHKTPAVKAFVEAVRAAPDRVEPYIALGHAMIVKGKIDLAEASYRTALDLEPEHVNARTALAMTLSREGHRDEAIETMNEVLEIDSANGFAHERLAIWHYYEGDFATAWEHVHAARRLDHPMPPQFINLLDGKMPDPAGG